eukprot:CAMPEP_0116577122 /NCGR_PEP_ID=MMETSP0397-20121206/20942_1 /TAXON_ID=216820 /ORGANISM="Cyclophora tenuis, Strain ECT3854" /LENGTH=217 /DNA_ID=CAMNT_0004106299 /DNA_START=241 /DNA_END=894 /DNA_ORIENTATION=+
MDSNNKTIQEWTNPRVDFVPLVQEMEAFGMTLHDLLSPHVTPELLELILLQLKTHGGTLEDLLGSNNNKKMDKVWSNIVLGEGGAKWDPESPPPHDANPVLVNLTVPVDLHDATTGWTIEVAYAKDQTGRLLGYSQFPASKRTNNESVESTTTDEKKEEEEEEEEGKLVFHVLPKETKTVVLYKIYKKSAEEDEYVIYQTRPILLAHHVQQAGMVTP